MKLVMFDYRFSVCCWKKPSSLYQLTCSRTAEVKFLERQVIECGRIGKKMTLIINAMVNRKLITRTLSYFLPCTL